MIPWWRPRGRRTFGRQEGAVALPGVGLVDVSRCARAQVGFAVAGEVSGGQHRVEALAADGADHDTRLHPAPLTSGDAGVLVKMLPVGVRPIRSA